MDLTPASQAHLERKPIPGSAVPVHANMDLADVGRHVGRVARA